MITTEPVPGVTPIPVIIIEAHESFWDRALAVGTLLLVFVTMLALLIEIHKDHEIIRGLMGLLSRLLPPYRKGVRAQEPDDAVDTDGCPMGLDAAGNEPL